MPSMITRRRLLTATLASVALPAAAAEKASLSAISAYLNTLRTVRAPFTQISDDGTTSTGLLYLKRPGRARFEYDPPNGARVIAGNGAVVIVDPKSNQPPESYPLKRTPLSIILAPKVDLSQADMVVGYGFDGSATIVTAQDPKNPEYGAIDLMFSSAPVALQKWVIRDGSGSRTTVVLGAMETGMALPNSLFSTTLRREGSDR
ncbi:MAG: LolA family protein [Marinibacterium sp.]